MRTKKQRLTMKPFVNPGWPTSCPIAATYSANTSHASRHPARPEHRETPLLPSLSAFPATSLASPSSHSARSSKMEADGTMPAAHRKWCIAWSTSSACAKLWYELIDNGLATHLTSPCSPSSHSPRPGLRIACESPLTSTLCQRACAGTGVCVCAWVRGVRLVIRVCAFAATTLSP